MAVDKKLTVQKPATAQAKVKRKRAAPAGASIPKSSATQKSISTVRQEKVRPTTKKSVDSAKKGAKKPGNASKTVQSRKRGGGSKKQNVASKSSTSIMILASVLIVLGLFGTAYFLTQPKKEANEVPAAQAEQVHSKENTEEEVASSDEEEDESFAVIKEYQRIEDAPKDAELYRVIASGIYVDVKDAHPYLKKRYTHNKEFYRRVKR